MPTISREAKLILLKAMARYCAQNADRLQRHVARIVPVLQKLNKRLTKARRNHLYGRLQRRPWPPNECFAGAAWTNYYGGRTGAQSPDKIAKNWRRRQFAGVSPNWAWAWNMARLGLFRAPPPLLTNAQQQAFIGFSDLPQRQKLRLLEINMVNHLREEGFSEANLVENFLEQVREEFWARDLINGFGDGGVTEEMATNIVNGDTPADRRGALFEYFDVEEKIRQAVRERLDQITGLAEYLGGARDRLAAKTRRLQRELDIAHNDLNELQIS
uniref:Uncharacterized protein n=1 Tax=Globodera rostochiensis TaxID=31243 RepID=A0A914HWU7_GLORO